MRMLLLATLLAILPPTGSRADDLPTKVTFDGPGRIKLVGKSIPPALP